EIRKMNEKQFVFDWNAENTSQDYNPFCIQLNIMLKYWIYWSEKPLKEMKKRDWYIFKEDFNITKEWREHRKDKINSTQKPFKLKTSNRMGFPPLVPKKRKLFSTETNKNKKTKTLEPSLEKQQSLLDKTNGLLASKGPMATEDSQAATTNLLQQSSIVNDRPSWDEQVSQEIKTRMNNEKLLTNDKTDVSSPETHSTLQENQVNTTTETTNTKIHDTYLSASKTVTTN
ncbi:1239_t:CDS:2, partial [Dentiscutata heterogama]